MMGTQVLRGVGGDQGEREVEPLIRMRFAFRTGSHMHKPRRAQIERGFICRCIFAFTCAKKIKKMKKIYVE